MKLVKKINDDYYYIKINGIGNLHKELNILIKSFIFLKENDIDYLFKNKITLSFNYYNSNYLNCLNSDFRDFLSDWNFSCNETEGDVEVFDLNNINNNNVLYYIDGEIYFSEKEKVNFSEKDKDFIKISEIFDLINFYKDMYIKTNDFIKFNLFELENSNEVYNMFKKYGEEKFLYLCKKTYFSYIDLNLKDFNERLEEDLKHEQKERIINSLGNKINNSATKIKRKI